MDKKNKIIIIIGIVVIILATVLIITLVDSMTDSNEPKNTGPYTLRPTTTQAQPSVTDSWVLDLNQIAGDATATDPGTTDPSSTSVITTMGNTGYVPGLFYDQYGNIVDAYGNIVVPHSNYQGGNNQGGSNNSGPSVDSTEALDVPNTEHSEMSEFEIDEEGVITKYLGNKTSIIIPTEENGKTITGIGAKCFEGTEVTLIQIPPTVEVIESYAFRNCRQLRTVYFVDESVHVIIGSSAFEGCDSLENIELPSVELGQTAFMRCKSLKTVSLGKGTKNIGSYAFNDCDSLQYIKLPDTVETIGTSIVNLPAPEGFYFIANEDSEVYSKLTEKNYVVKDPDDIS